MPRATPAYHGFAARAVVGTPRTTTSLCMWWIMRKTRHAAIVVWVSLIWLTIEAYLGRLIMLKVRQLFLVVLNVLNMALNWLT